METIKQYLETMFASLPDTTEVRKAKEELLEMMEDKYNELLAEGKSDNEAVGIVIAEFGNLDEVAEELGIRGVMDGERGSSGMERTASRHVTAEEAEQFLKDKKKDSFKTALGVLLCIYSVIGPIMTDAVFRLQGTAGADAIGVSLMMGMIGAAVCLFVYSSLIMKKWSFLQKEPFYLDFLTKQKLAAKKEEFRVPHAMSLTIGIVLCVVSFVPAAILSEVEFHFNRVVDLDSLGGALLFVLVGIGVFLIVYASMVNGSFDTLLKNSGTVGTSGRGAYKGRPSGKEKYISPGAEIFLSVYWYSVTCIYLIWSFLTFNWHFTWIVWPVAAVMYAGLSKVLKVEEDDE
jgi:hypothetical protein